MFLTEKLAVAIGEKAEAALNIDNDKKQVIVYGAINLLQMLFAILGVAVVSLFLGVFYEAMIFSITMSILRKYSGGIHASTPGRCVAVGTVTSALAGILIDKFLYKVPTVNVMILSVICILISLLIVAVKAPVDSSKKPINDIKIKKQFKKKSIVSIFVFSFIVLILYMVNKENMQTSYIRLIESISLGMFWQSITLLPKRR